MLPVQTRFTIQEAGQACALNPSVLRIWEARYGWPRPQRRKNGYRIYDYQQIEELKQVASLVRSGHAISTLVRDGEPHLAEQHPPIQCPYARLDDLPRPSDPEARGLQQQLVRALRHQQFGAARGVIERANWALHPRQLVPACFVPTLIALAEIQRLPCSSPAQDPDGQHLLHEAIAGRCQELLGRLPAGRPILAVQPLCSEDETLALVVALALNLADRPARVVHRDETLPRSMRCITVSDRLSPMPRPGLVGHVSALENERYWTLAQIPNCVPRGSEGSN